MPHDAPIAHTADGRPLFDNTPTVVCVVAFLNDHLVVIRRANEPGRGKLGLPGGYHMRGESWEQAGAREFLEETGYTIDPAALEVYSLVTDEYGNNLIIAKYTLELAADAPKAPTDGEGEVELIWDEDYNSMSPYDWAFPRHFKAGILRCIEHASARDEGDA